MNPLFALALELRSEGLSTAKRDLAGLDRQGKLLAASFRLVGTALAGIGFAALFRQAITEAGDAERAMASLEQAVTNAGGNFDELKVAAETAAGGIQRLTRFSDDAAIGALAKLTAITNDGAKAIRNLGLASDIAAFKGIALEQGAEIVGRVLMGNNRILKEFGINVKDGGDVMQQLRDKFGGFAEKEGATFQGRLQQVRNEFLNVLEALGRVITDSDSTADMMGKLRDKLGELAGYIDRNADKWKAWAKDALKSVSDWYVGFKERADNVAHAFNVIAASANTAGAAMRVFLTRGGDIEAWKNLIENQKELNRVMAEGAFADVTAGYSEGTGPDSLKKVVITEKAIRDRAAGSGAGDGKIKLPSGQGVDVRFGGLKQFEEQEPEFDWTTSVESAELEKVFKENRERMERAVDDELAFLAEQSQKIVAAGQQIADTITGGMAQTLGDAIYNAFSAAFNGEGLGGIFKEFGKTILAGIGQTFTQLGMIYLQYGGIMQALAAFLPNPFTAGWAGIAIGSALIAMGGALGAVASRGGQASRGTASAGSFRERPTDDITRYKFIDRNGSLVNSLAPRTPINVTIIGPNDPTAQRMVTELVEKASRRAA